MNGKNKRRQEVPVKRRTAAIRSQSLGHRLALDFRKNKLKYLMVIPILILLFYKSTFKACLSIICLIVISTAGLIAMAWFDIAGVPDFSFIYLLDVP